MKWFYFSLTLFLVLTVIGISIVFLNFDPDSFRPQIQVYLQKVFQHEVQLGPLELRWQGVRPTVSSDELLIKNSGTEEVLLESKRIWVSVQLLPLLQHKIFINHFKLEKIRISVVRDEQGAWNWDPKTFRKFQPSGNSPWQDAGSWKMQIAVLSASNASIYYADRSQLPYYHFESQGLDLEMLEPLEPTSKLQISPHNPNKLFSAVYVSLLGREQLLFEGDFGNLGRGEFQVMNPFEDAHFEGKLWIEQADLRLIPGISRFIEGSAGIKLEVSGEGLHPADIKRTLIVKGGSEIQKGIWHSHNFVAETLDALATIPGFSELTRNPLTGEFYDFSHSSDTAFQMVRVQFEASNGKVFLSDFEAFHPMFRVQGEGSFNLIDNHLDFKGNCFFLGKFAAHLVSRVSDIDALSNLNGELEIPFSYNGMLEEIHPAPNFFYIANRLIQVHGEELASRGIQKINEFLEAYHS